MQGLTERTKIGQVEAPDLQSGERRLSASQENPSLGQALAMVAATEQERRHRCSVGEYSRRPASRRIGTYPR
jgi:hypothetical protein